MYKIACVPLQSRIGVVPLVLVSSPLFEAVPRQAFALHKILISHNNHGLLRMHGLT